MGPACEPADPVPMVSSRASLVLARITSPWMGAILLFALAVGCFATVRTLEGNAQRQHQARTDVVEVKAAMQDIFTPIAPALLASGLSTSAGPGTLAPKEIAALEQGVEAVDEKVLRGFAHLRETPSGDVDRAMAAWAVVQRSLDELVQREPLAVTLPDMWMLGGLLAQAKVHLESADDAYLRAANRAEIKSLVGSAMAIGFAFLGFAIAFAGAHRSRGQAVASRMVAEGLAEENARLLASSRVEATTDALTGLANRRRLFMDLNHALETVEGDDPLVLVLFDLDGFKRYNDTFGHPAGDALLTRLGEQLRLAFGSQDGVYRMGGDEFCILARLEVGSIDAISERAAVALSAEGGGFKIGCSHGAVVLPQEAGTAEQALQMADRRMYAQKNRFRVSGSADVGPLLQVQVEQSADLGLHSHQVTDLAEKTARLVGLGDAEIAQIRIASELHDIGKTAIPDRILEKPGPLEDEEWVFMKQHTLIGERILVASPGLAVAAPIVRSSHERFDGTGYPDGLAGDEIPLAARIIAVCDSFDAMRSERCYAPALALDDAIAELRRCAGTQFDPRVVEAFLEVFEAFKSELQEAEAAA
jgi:diguanylate cyclase (GGDEF)-like protein